MVHDLLSLHAGPTVEPNLWMWVNPNIVFPPGKLEVPEPRKGEDQPSTLPSPQPPPKEEDLADCSSEATAGESESLPSSSEQSPPRKRMRFASSPSTWEVGVSGPGGWTWAVGRAAPG